MEPTPAQAEKTDLYRPLRLRNALCAPVLALLAAGALQAGCLSRPLETAEPRSTSTVVEVLTQSVDKIDLLLAIDDSGSMADKQQILASAVPDLVRRLANPPCLAAEGGAVFTPKNPDDDCPAGMRREFKPVYDIHVGIITSSLGYRDAAGVCGKRKHDNAHLVARTSPAAENNIPTYDGKGFLAWDLGQTKSPAGEDELGDVQSGSGLIPTFRDMVIGVGQDGCGQEAQLESWYRFLVDPEPYSDVILEDGRTRLRGVDELVKAQRADFLRPDSLLAILMLTDENDCSINEEGFAHRVSSWDGLPRMRHECAADVNDACCAPCGEEAPECAPDPTCDQAMSEPDSVHLRCFDQKARYGFDFLHPIERYVNGLTSPEVANRQGKMVPNPIFSVLNSADAGDRVRDKSLVFFAGIVGVPWQDVARDPNDLGKGFKNAAELEERDAGGVSRWDVILGDPSKGVLPLDPFMRESVAYRPLMVNPVTGDPILLPGGATNAINGHERSLVNELQYACTMPLPQPKPCASNDPGCACANPDPNEPNPLCEKDESGHDTSTQSSAGATPGLRQLEVLKRLGTQGIVASVCAAQTDDPAEDRADYGYRPAIGALVDRLKSELGKQCLPRTLETNEKDQVSCLVLEARKSDGACDCSAESARVPVAAAHQGAVSEAMRHKSAEAAGWDCFCEIPQLEAEPLKACQDDASLAPMSGGEPVDGWCYIDATTPEPIGNPALVAKCDPNEQRMIRFTGKGDVRPGATLFITCANE